MSVRDQTPLPPSSGIWALSHFPCRILENTPLKLPILAFCKPCFFSPFSSAPFIIRPPGCMALTHTNAVRTSTENLLPFKNLQQSFQKCFKKKSQTKSHFSRIRLPINWLTYIWSLAIPLFFCIALANRKLRVTWPLMCLVGLGSVGCLYFRLAYYTCAMICMKIGLKLQRLN